MGYTALHFGAAVDSPQILQAILDHDPQMANIQAQDGWTALHFACRGWSLSCTKVLLEALKDPNEEQIAPESDDKGRTALHHVEYPISELISELWTTRRSRIKVRTEVRSSDKSAKYQIIQLMLKENPALGDLQDIHGRTILHQAASVGDCAVIEICLSFGLKVSLKSMSLLTPLDEALIRGQRWAVTLLRQYQFGTSNRLESAPTEDIMPPPYILVDEKVTFFEELYSGKTSGILWGGNVHVARLPGRKENTRDPRFIRLPMNIQRMPFVHGVKDLEFLFQKIHF